MGEEQKHIVFYLNNLMRGGSERVMMNLAVYLYEHGYKVTFVTTYLGENEYEVPHAAWRVLTKEEAKTSTQKVREVMYVDETPGYVNPRVPLPDGERGIFRVWSGLLKKDQGAGRTANLSKRTRMLHQIWEKLRPDLILSTNGKNNVMALLSSIGLGIPVVVRVGANPSMEYSSHQLYISMASTFRRAAGVVLQMEAQKKFFPPAIQERTTILRNSIDASFIKPRYEGEREKTIVSVGRLDQNKNQTLLLKAFARIKDKYRDWKIILYGEGNMKKQLVSLSHALDIHDNVEFAGQVDRIDEAIYTAGVFVLSSNEEGMPNALIEAMAMGLPVISTDCPCGGPKELITDAENGLLVPVGDVARMETALVRILGNPGFARTLGTGAAQIQELYHPDTVNAAWEQYLSELMVPQAQTVAS
ncbi:MAG: glycosyltransferase [Lachnospiraceae bacterium]|nr:glycosyltransferase [Lachnospiraceae bacterium]